MRTVDSRRLQNISEIQTVEFFAEFIGAPVTFRHRLRIQEYGET
jgi:hypothetical protein